MVLVNKKSLFLQCVQFVICPSHLPVCQINKYETRNRNRNLSPVGTYAVCL